MKKITEQILLDGYDGISNGIDIMSIVNGKTIWWNWRRCDEQYQPVCNYENADYISLKAIYSDEYEDIIAKTDRIEIDEKNIDHPAIKTIQKRIKEIVYA